MGDGQHDARQKGKGARLSKEAQHRVQEVAYLYPCGDPNASSPERVLRSAWGSAEACTPSDGSMGRRIDEDSGSESDEDPDLGGLVSELDFWPEREPVEKDLVCLARWAHRHELFALPINKDGELVTQTAKFRNMYYPRSTIFEILLVWLVIKASERHIWLPHAFDYPRGRPYKDITIRVWDSWSAWQRQMRRDGIIETVEEHTPLALAKGLRFPRTAERPVRVSWTPLTLDDTTESGTTSRSDRSISQQEYMSLGREERLRTLVGVPNEKVSENADIVEEEIAQHMAEAGSRGTGALQQQGREQKKRSKGKQHSQHVKERRWQKLTKRQQLEMQQEEQQRREEELSRQQARQRQLSVGVGPSNRSKGKQKAVCRDRRTFGEIEAAIDLATAKLAGRGLGPAEMEALLRDCEAALEFDALQEDRIINKLPLYMSIRRNMDQSLKCWREAIIVG